MEDPQAFRDDSTPRRSPTPGGMYRRAEMRAYAESTAPAGVVAAASVELPTDAPSFSAPDIVAAIGHVDPVVRTIPPLAETVPYIPGRPPGRQPSVAPRGAFPIRRRPVVLATVAVGVVALLWLARQPAPITAPAATPQPAPVAVIPPLPTSTPSNVQSLPASPESTAPRDAPARTSLVDPVLRITSDPAGARVTVNGVGWGATPVVIRHLPPGPKTIRATKEGYTADQRVVSLSDTGAASVQLRLRRNPDRPAASTAGIRQR